MTDGYSGAHGQIVSTVILHYGRSVLWTPFRGEAMVNRPGYSSIRENQEKARCFIAVTLPSQEDRNDPFPFARKTDGGSDLTFPLASAAADKLVKEWNALKKLLGDSPRDRKAEVSDHDFEKIAKVMNSWAKAGNLIHRHERKFRLTEVDVAQWAVCHELLKFIKWHKRETPPANRDGRSQIRTWSSVNLMTVQNPNSEHPFVTCPALDLSLLGRDVKPAKEQVRNVAFLAGFLRDVGDWFWEGNSRKLKALSDPLAVNLTAPLDAGVINTSGPAQLEKGTTSQCMILHYQEDVEWINFTSLPVFPVTNGRKGNASLAKVQKKHCEADTWLPLKTEHLVRTKEGKVVNWSFKFLKEAEANVILDVWNTRLSKQRAAVLKEDFETMASLVSRNPGFIDGNNRKLKAHGLGHLIHPKGEASSSGTVANLGHHVKYQPQARSWVAKKVFA
ncbi:hypothetical protein T439DRAFT_381631 [Meredithblackwellia eburnea MCA 4105]